MYLTPPEHESRILDGPAIRNADRGDSHESIRRKPLFNFHNVRAIRANRLKPAIRNFSEGCKGGLYH